LPARGWYDGRTVAVVGERPRAGDGCIEYHWTAGSTTPERSSALRRLFEPTETVYLRFFIRLSSGWGWSGRSYHPHLIQLMTTEDDRYHGPAASHLTVYVEPQGGRLRLAAQDIANRDAPHSLTQGPLRGGFNGTFFDSKDVLFEGDAWHCVEALFRLNSLDRGRDRPNADGVVRAWFDGRLLVERTDVVLRSTDFPDMKFNQLLLAPYFGPGLLPHEQTLWIDELDVGTGRPGPARSSSPDAGATVRVARPSRRTARSTSGWGPPRSWTGSIDRSGSWNGSSTGPGLADATRWRCRRTRSACSTGRRRTRRPSARCSPRRSGGCSTGSAGRRRSTACTWSSAATPSSRTAAPATPRPCSAATAARSAATGR
jgi:hypothetical protein